MEVLYHIRPYFLGISPYIGLKIGFIYGRYLQFRIPEWPLIYYRDHQVISILKKHKQPEFFGSPPEMVSLALTRKFQ